MKNLLSLCLIILFSSVVSGENILCPLRPDPPPSIDGDISEWYQSSGSFKVKGENITYNKAGWKGENDLSGTLWLGWDKNHLYLAAEVIDDMFFQDKSGKDIWLGDHLEFDFDPKYKPGVKDIFAKEQFVMGFSPGNLQDTGDPLFDMPPECYIWRPIGLEPPQIDVAVLRTEDGYTLEASIPWKLFGIKPKQGMIFGVDFRISDSDGPNSQDAMTSLFPKKWIGRRRERLIQIKLGDTEGK